jgi:hypothetical protein
VSTKKIIPTAAELARQALADARTKLAECEALHVEAQVAAEELRDRLASGDASVTAVDLMTARTEQERTELLAQAAAQAVARTERALVNDCTELGDLFAELLAELFSGLVPVKVVTTRRDVIASEAGEPMLFVVQEKPGSSNGGVLSGELTVTFHRPELFAPLNADRVQRRCEDHGFTVDVLDLGSAQGEGQHRDSLRIKVRQAFSKMPTLAAAPNDEALHHFALGVADRLSASVRAVGRREFHYAADGPVVDNFGKLTACQIVRTESGPDGEERTTVEVSVNVMPSRRLEGDRAQRMRQALEHYTGTVEPRAGRVADVEVLTLGVPDFRPGARNPWVVTARFGLAYRVSTAA